MKNHSLIIALLLLATALVYAIGLNNPFATDDRYIILKNFQPWQKWTLKNMFESSLFSTDPSESVYEAAYFRPLTLLTFALNYPLAGEGPKGYRVVNIGLHFLVAALMTLFLSLVAGKWIAIFSALLFAVHPVHVEAVSYISSRSDPLYTISALLCLLLWHKGNQTEKKNRPFYLSMALLVFFFGLFAKETMVVTPALALLADLLSNPSGSWKTKIKENLGWYTGCLSLFFVYLLIRHQFGFPFLMEGGRKLDVSSRLPLALKLFALYMGLAFYPAHLSFFRTVPIPQSFLEWQVVLGTILFAGTVILAWLARRTGNGISFGILWYLISLLPVLNLSLLNAPMMEHWLYLPMIGLTLAFVGGVRTLAERLGEVRASALGLILLALLLSARTITRNAEWSDLLKLYLHDVSSYPGNSVAWGRLGDTMTERGMLKEAIQAYQASLAINSNNMTAWLSLGRALSLAGRYDEAEEILSRAVSVRPRDSWSLYILGVHRLIAGRSQAAIDALEESIALKPSPIPYHVLGSAYWRLGQKGKAEQSLDKAVAMYPGQARFHAGVHVDLGKLYMSQERPKQAREEWQIALRFKPDDKEAHRLLEKTAR